MGILSVVVYPFLSMLPSERLFLDKDWQSELDVANMQSDGTCCSGPHQGNFNSMIGMYAMGAPPSWLSFRELRLPPTTVLRKLTKRRKENHSQTKLQNCYVVIDEADAFSTIWFVALAFLHLPLVTRACEGYGCLRKKKRKHIAPKLAGGVCRWERQSKFVKNQKTL